MKAIDNESDGSGSSTAGPLVPSPGEGWARRNRGTLIFIAVAVALCVLAYALT